MSGNIFLFQKVFINNGFQTIRAIQTQSELSWQLLSLALVETLDAVLGSRDGCLAGTALKAPRCDCLHVSVHPVPCGASLVAQMVKSPPAKQETWVPSLGQEDPPGEGNGNPLQYSCLENPMDRWRSLVGYSPWNSPG